MSQNVFYPGQNLKFTANVSGGVPPYSYSWNFGDGTTASTNPAYHSYSTPGYYTITVTVTDAINDKASASVTINIEVVPTLTLTVSGVKTYNNAYWAVEGSTIGLTAQLLENGLGLRDQDIEFYVNNTQVGHGLTDDSGTVTVYYTVNTTGQLQIYAYYPGVSPGYASVTSNTVTVNAVAPLSVSVGVS